MMSEKKIKSALELAMERMDAKHGSSPSLNDEQKEQLAEIERRGQAKVAEMNIMHQKNMAEAGGDYGKVLELEDALRRAQIKIDEGIEEEKQAVRDR